MEQKPGEIIQKDGKTYIVTDDKDLRECVKMADGSIYLVSEDGKLHIYKDREF